MVHLAGNWESCLAMQIRLSYVGSSHHIWPIVTAQQAGCKGLVWLSWVIGVVQTAGLFMRTPTLRGVCRDLEMLPPEQVGVSSHQH